METLLLYQDLGHPDFVFSIMSDKSPLFWFLPYKPELIYGDTVEQGHLKAHFLDPPAQETSQAFIPWKVGGT